MLTTFEDDTLQRRASLKHRRAQLMVAKSTVAESDNILAKLEQSKDDAVAEHGETTVRIQSQLDAVDAADIASIVAGTSPSQESLDRRRALLQELNEANQALELKLEAARRSIATVQKQIEETRNEAAHLPIVEGQIRKLCSTRTRQDMVANEFLRGGLQSVLRELRRRIGIQSEHVEIHRRNRDEGSADGLFASQRLDDLRAAQTKIEQAFTDAIAESERLQQVALDE